MEAVTFEKAFFKNQASISVKTTKGEYRQVLVREPLLTVELKTKLVVGAPISCSGRAQSRGTVLYVQSITVASKKHGVSKVGRLEAQRRYFSQFDLVTCTESETGEVSQRSPSDCVFYDGKFYQKIQFCMDKLTPAVVTQRLLSAGYNLAGVAKDPKGYRALIDDMVADALAIDVTPNSEAACEIPF